MITNIAISSLEILPVEIFHEILNYLDTSSIFFSFYNICSRFNAFLISYNRYKLDLSLILRSDFDTLFYLIHPRNIISLILSNDNQTPGQIDLFLSFINIQEFNRLRSLTLLQVGERNLIVFLKHLPFHNLITLSIKWQGESCCYSDHTEVLKLLSSIISQPKLRYLDLSLWIYEIKNLSWSINCTVQVFRTDSCSFSEYYHILNHLPHLKTFILNNGSMFGRTDPFLSSLKYPSHNQLLSLTLENIEHIQMNKLEYILSLTPSLVYLKLIGSGYLHNDAFDGSQWENFIQQHLPFLKKFEFFFSTLRNIDQSIDDVFLLIAPFLNNFWVEKKRWFITCDFIISSSQIRLYSIPICQSYLEYIPKSDIISCSTLIITDNHVNMMHGVRTMSVNLSTAIIEQEDQSISNPIFPQVTEVTLEMTNQVLIVSSQFFSTLFNPLNLVKISLNIYFDKDSTWYIINAIVDVLEQAPNIHTFHNNNKSADARIICAIVPRHVKYLQVKIDRINDMKMIVEQLDHLSSITFQFSKESPNRCQEFVKWLSQRKKLFTFRGDSIGLRLWLDNNLTRL